MKKIYIFITFLMVKVVTIAGDIIPLTYSGTLPVIFIETKDGLPIESKNEYIDAYFYLDALGIDGFESLGDKEHTLSLQIRGRGNYTWQSFEKKPYRLKFDKKYSILGMKKNKHFALLAHADDEMGFLRNAVGFEISRRMNFRYTPEQYPVEVVLNGDYIGLYFLAETIRVDENRLNIADGGWLVELDNYDDDSQIRFDISHYNLDFFKVTYHAPEVLSDIQYDWLNNQFTEILNAIYTPDKNNNIWEEYIDIDWLVKYYIAMEAVDHLEAFLGSCYLHKDVNDKKWIFGPFWDIGHAFNGGHPKNKFMYEDTWFPPSIIDEIVKFPHFQQKVREFWPIFYHDIYPFLDDFIDAYANRIALAVRQNYVLWPQYGNADEYARAKKVKDKFKEKVEFLQSQWGNKETKIMNVRENGHNSYSEELYNLSGQKLPVKSKMSGIYIIQTKHKDGKIQNRKIIY